MEQLNGSDVTLNRYWLGLLALEGKLHKKMHKLNLNWLVVFSMCLHNGPL